MAFDIRGVLHLAGGSVATQLIPVAVAPILTRLYSPDDYAGLAVFLALAALFTAGAAGRYQMATLIPGDHETSLHITQLCLRIITCTTIAMTVVLAIAYPLLHDVGPIEPLGPWLLLVPLAGGLASANEALGASMVRLNRTGQVGRSAATKALTGAGSQVTLGYAGATSGLLVGTVLGAAAGNTRLAIMFRQARREHVTGKAPFRRLLRRYANFPKYDLPAYMANVLGFNVLVLGIGALFSASTLGLYALAYRLILLPSSLIGTAIGQIFLREASRISEPRLAVRHYYRTAAGLAAIALPAFVILFLTAERLFSFAFGEEWKGAGVIARSLLPFILVRFVVSPLTGVFALYERQRLLLVLQVCLLAGNVGSVCVTAALGWPLEGLVAAFTVTSVVVYLSMFVAGRFLVGRPRETACRVPPRV